MQKTGLELPEAGAPCRLRPCEERDGPAIDAAAAESIERVGKWMSSLTPAYTLADSLAWARAASADWHTGSRYEFVILDAVSGRVCGCCGLNRINREDLVANLGYWVRESALRRGIATAAARMLQEFGLGTVGLKRIEIVIADGTGSRPVLAPLSGRCFLFRFFPRLKRLSENAQGLSAPQTSKFIVDARIVFLRSQRPVGFYC